MSSLAVVVPPRINETASSSANTQVIISRTATLQCHVHAVPAPDIEWIVNGRPIDRSNPRFRLSTDGRRLEIMNSELSDSGRFTCVAKNDAGIVDRDYDLEVLGEYIVAIVCDFYVGNDVCSWPCGLRHPGALWAPGCKNRQQTAPLPDWMSEKGD